MPKKHKRVGNLHFFSPNGMTVEVRLYDEIWNKVYCERASVNSEKQMLRLLEDLSAKGVVFRKV